MAYAAPSPSSTAGWRWLGKKSWTSATAPFMVSPHNNTQGAPRRRNMELVGSAEDIRNNLVAFDQALMEEDDASGFYHELVRGGWNFISYQVEREWRFAPSRYIGYKNNSEKRHEQNRDKDGGKTDVAISRALDHDQKPNKKRSGQFHKFAKRLYIKPHDKERRFWTFSGEQIEHTSELEEVHPEELPKNELRWEGAKMTAFVNRFERNSLLRDECVQEHGYKCKVCGFDFYATYGQIGQRFIHVHHLRPLASVGDAHEVDPVDDLIPVCPNCHAMLHRKRDADKPRTVEQLKKLIDAQK